MIVLLNGAFGIGKTTVARLLVARIPRAVLLDPEIVGIALQRTARLLGRRVDDFQDLKTWRRWTIAALRITRVFWPNVIVPMAFSNEEYLHEIRRGLNRFEPHVLHFCLITSLPVVHERLRQRGDAAEWEYRRAAECCAAHQSDAFATHIDATDRAPEEIAGAIGRSLASAKLLPR